MTTRKILQTFGFELWRNSNNGQWIAARPDKSFSAEYLHDLIEQIVPEPPERLTAAALRAWGAACRAAAPAEAYPEDVARAAFEAYDIDSPDEFIECFVSAWDAPECIYYDILDTVVGNGRLEFGTPEELEIEIEHEARERGLSDEEIEEAIAYAFEHYQFAEQD